MPIDVRPRVAIPDPLPLLIPDNWQQGNNIGFVRLVLAIAVIFSHAFPVTAGNNDHEPVYRLFPAYASFGRLAVVGFFALSGLLISQSWLGKPDLQEFTIRRIVRIWPGFAAASILVVLLIVPFGTDRPAVCIRSLLSAPVVMGHLARAAFLQQPKSQFGFETNPTPHILDGSLWTIIYEFSWYGVVALLGLLSLVGKRWPMALLATIVLVLDGYVGSRQAHGAAREIGGMTLEYWLAFGAAFSIGMAALAWRDSIPRHPVLLAVALASFVPAHYHPKLIIALLPTSYVYLLFWFAFSSSTMLNDIGNRVDLSYGVYLYAFAIEQLLVFRCHWLRSPTELFIVATVMTLPLALFSWFCVEGPAKNLGHRRRSVGRRVRQV